MNSDTPRPGEEPDRPQNRRTPAQPRREQTDQFHERPDQSQSANRPAPDPSQPDKGMDEPIRFDGDRNAPSRETESAAPGPSLATGMFFPVVILVVVAIVIILVFVL